MARLFLINRYFYPDLSATSQLASDLVGYLASCGWNVCVITSRHCYNDPSNKLPATECQGGAEIRRVWSFAFGRDRLIGRMLDYLSFYLSSTIKLLFEARQNDVIIATTDPPLISVAGAFVATARRARLINWIQDVFPEVAVALKVKGVSGPLAYGLTAARDWSLRKATANVVIGELMASRLGGALGAINKRYIVPNWALNSGTAEQDISSEDLRAAWGLDGRFVVGYSGNLGRAHSWEPFFAAASRLSHRNDIRFLFIGGGAGMRELGRAAATARLENVLFLDYQPIQALERALRVPDVHLVTLKPALEGLIVPSKLYGVLASARPVIFVGRPDGEVGRVVTSGRCGLVVDEQDVEGLTEAIESLAADPGRARELGQRGKQLLSSHFSKDRAMQAWSETLNRLPN